MAVDVNRIIQAAAEAALDDQASPRSQQRDGNQRKRKGLTAPRALLVGAGLATVARAATHKKFLRIAKFGVEKLVDVPNVHDLSDAVRDRLADHGLLHEDEDEQYPLDDEWDERDDDEDEDFGDNDPDDLGDEPPQNEAEEDWDEEEDDEPRDEADDEPRDEEDDEPSDEEDDEPSDEEDDEPSEEGDEEPEAEGEEDWDDEADEDEDESDAPGIALGSANGDAAERAERGLDAALQSGRTRGATPELMRLLDSPHSPPPALRRARKEDPVKRPPQPARRTRQDDERSKPTQRARSSNSHSNPNPKKPAGRKQKGGRN